MKCTFGPAPHDATFGPNEGFYGKRYTSGAGSYMAWYCKEHDAFVGVHGNDAKRPLGTLANGPLRRARMQVHATIDPLWKQWKMKRGKVYAILSEYFGEPYHTGEADLARCREVLEAAPRLFGVARPLPLPSEEESELDKMTGVRRF